MRRTACLFALLLLGAIWPVSAEDAVILFAQDIPASEFVGVLYREILHRPFVVSPAVQASRALVSLHFHGSREEAERSCVKYLQGIGFTIRAEAGVDRVEILEPPKVVERKERRVPVFYRPRFRDPGELGASLRALFADIRVSVDAPSSGGVDGAASAHGGGTSRASSPVLAALVLEGEAPEVRRMLPQLDVPGEDLVIRAAVFEVGLSADSGSAFSVALQVLRSAAGELRNLGGAFRSGGEGSHLAVGRELAVAGAVSSLNLGAASVEAVISSLATDSRFSLITSPAVRARSGVPTALSVGQSVPVLGAVTLNRDAGAVQSVEYRDSGVIFSVRPFVQSNSIQLDVHQEISDFIQTTTGVNSSPTLTKRALTGSLSVRDGEVVMLGGLSQKREAEGFQGFSLSPRIGGSSSSSSRADLLVVLQVSRLGRSVAPPIAVSGDSPRSKGRAVRRGHPGVSPAAVPSEARNLAQDGQ